MKALFVTDPLNAQSGSSSEPAVRAQKLDFGALRQFLDRSTDVNKFSCQLPGFAGCATPVHFWPQTFVPIPCVVLNLPRRTVHLPPTAGFFLHAGNDARVPILLTNPLPARFPGFWIAKSVVNNLSSCQRPEFVLLVTQSAFAREN